MVSFQLNTDSNPLPSKITIGGVDETAYNGDLNVHNIDTYNKAWWTIGYGGVNYDGKSISSSYISAAIIDTGTSFLYLP